VCGGSFAVTQKPVVASTCDEKIVGDVELVPLADLDGLSFDESSALQSVHGMAGEMSRAASLHLQSELSGAQARVGASEVNDRQRHHFVGDQLVWGV
jgi:hypothetical protein